MVSPTEQALTVGFESRGLIPPREQEYPILGLNSLRLLVQNKIPEFHTEPEVLALEAHDHTCLKHAVELDQSIVEGAYDRVVRARHGVAHETYGYLLAKTVRSCRAYVLSM